MDLPLVAADLTLFAAFALAATTVLLPAVGLGLAFLRIIDRFGDKGGVVFVAVVVAMLFTARLYLEQAAK
jgi:hypothetical protein